MATAKVPPLSSHAQFQSIDTVCQQGCSLYIALIQQPVRKWEKPWRHHRVIVLLATSAQETKLRLHIEDRIRHGELILQVVKVGEQ
jgi:hypothetical protein